MIVSRRQFQQMAFAAAGAALLERGALALTPAKPGTFRFAVITDTHIIDDFYRGPEGSPEDTETIFKANANLLQTRATINAITPAVEQVFHAGDFFHNYPSADYDFYFKNKTRIDIAYEMVQGFKAPVHIGFGNHDYDEHQTPGVSREMSNRLFEAKLKTKPYYAVDYKGFRFLQLNNFLGETWDPKAPVKMRQMGSLGEEQLNWTEAQLAERKPTVILIHYPLWLQQPTEVKDYGLHPMLRKYSDNIQMVIAGHWHKWVDFSRTYGPRHIVSAATRYDPNAFMIFDADPKAGTIEWIDMARTQWSTHYSTPYKL
ncbi:metallophosphoesterase [Terriglobus sp. 2YAB30_2]|uniref:metallophosphoesterase family protein n=3 Tax=unclassified Terriglobus TaxID=2628988 RepID=UPI003F9D8444